MLVSKIKAIKNGRLIVKDSKIGDANPDGTISPDEEKRMAELLREANESKSRLKAKAYEIGGSFRGPGNWKRVKSILTSDSKTRDRNLVDINQERRRLEDKYEQALRDGDKGLAKSYSDRLEKLRKEAIEAENKRDEERKNFGDSKTKDAKTQHEYKGYILEWDNEDNNIPAKIISPSGKVIFTYVIGTMPTLTGFNSKVDAHLSKTKDAKSLSSEEAYDEGFEAAKVGKPITANPYQDVSRSGYGDLKESWADGWKAGKRMKDSKTKDVVSDPAIKSGVLRGIVYTIRRGKNNRYYGESDLDDEIFDEGSVSDIEKDLKAWIQGHAGR